MKHLDLERTLIFFDLETTGVDPATDRIVEIALLGFDPGGESWTRSRRINPMRPIPAGATAVHGIRDEDVRDEPTFKQVAGSLLERIGDADLAGFNVRRFDVPLLVREFADCGMELRLSDRRIIDVMTVFHRKEPRDLTAAVRFYLDREHVGAHAAEADIRAAAEVLDAQLRRYEDLPRTVPQLEAWLQPKRPGAIDAAGKFVWRDGEAVFGFGKHQGRTLREVAGEAPDYLRWIEQSDFPDDARELARQALAGRFPDPQSA